MLSISFAVNHTGEYHNKIHYYHYIVLYLGYTSWIVFQLKSVISRITIKKCTANKHLMVISLVRLSFAQKI